MAMYMLMPKIPGSTTAKGDEQWISLFSLSCDAGRKIETAPGRVNDRIHSDALGSEMEIFKPIDQSSPLLFSEACGGSAIPQVKIDICHSSTDGFVMYMQYILSHVMVSSYHAHIDEVDGHYELITLNYTDVEMSLIPQDASGQLESPIKAQAQVGCWPHLATFIAQKIRAKTSDGFNLFVATVYGEAGGVHYGREAAWRAIGSVIINRINSGIWRRYYSSDDIIKHTGFNASLTQIKSIGIK
ncbi:MAG: type VI secretion system tube protein Hcp [Proteobacteria bacterium]|nr:type VI secretion system tube protein Hcp [Pseudomonadota bacterium]